MRDGRLHIWPRLDKTDPRVLAVKDTVLSMNLGKPVKPFWYSPGVSEGVTRVLVLADGFEHGPIVNYIYPRKPALLREAIEWVLHIREESRGGRDSMELMRSIFGEELRETTEEHFERGAGAFS